MKKILYFTKKIYFYFLFISIFVLFTCDGNNSNSNTPSTTPPAVETLEGKIGYNSSDFNLYMHTLETKNTEKLTTNGANYFIRFSKDGTKGVFESTDPDFKNNIHLITLPSKTVTEVTTGENDFEPNISPDGEDVVYNDVNYFLRKIKSDGTDDIQITSDTRTYCNPQFSSDKKFIYVLSNREDDYFELYKVPFPKTDRFIKITNLRIDSPTFGFSVNPEGTELIYSYGKIINKKYGYAIARCTLANTDPSESKDIILDISGNAVRPCYSPSGKGFLYNVGDPLWTNPKINYANIDGAGQKLLLENAMIGSWVPGK